MFVPQAEAKVDVMPPNLRSVPSLPEPRWPACPSQQGCQGCRRIPNAKRAKALRMDSALAPYFVLRAFEYSPPKGRPSSSANQTLSLARFELVAKPYTDSRGT